MAHLPKGPEGTEWLITSFNNDVYVIENPGLDNEVVHFHFENFVDTNVNGSALDKVTESEVVTPEQKSHILFWLGYFYRSFISQASFGV